MLSCCLESCLSKDDKITLHTCEYRHVQSWNPPGLVVFSATYSGVTYEIRKRKKPLKKWLPFRFCSTWWHSKSRITNFNFPPDFLCYHFCCSIRDSDDSDDGRNVEFTFFRCLLGTRNVKSWSKNRERRHLVLIPIVLYIGGDHSAATLWTLLYSPFTIPDIHCYINLSTINCMIWDLPLPIGTIPRLLASHRSISSLPLRAAPTGCVIRQTKLPDMVSKCVMPRMEAYVYYISCIRK